MKLVIVGMMVFVVLSVLSGNAHAQPLTLGEVLVFHVPDLKPDANTKAFEEYVLTEVAPGWKKVAGGMELHLVRADRGSRKGQYMLAWTTDTRHGQKRSASRSGSSLAQELRAKAVDFRRGFEPFVNGDGQYREYHLIGPEKVGTLPDVEVLGIHYTKVRPDRRDAFEAFVAGKIHPAVANLRPDIRILYYKPVGAAGDGQYLAVFALTIASRDKYWPNGSDSDDLRAAFSPAIRTLAKELSAYLVEGSYAADPKLAAAVYESREWTDFVVIAHGR